jgi:hypothetical protein
MFSSHERLRYYVLSNSPEVTLQKYSALNGIWRVKPCIWDTMKRKKMNGRLLTGELYKGMEGWRFYGNPAFHAFKLS